MAANTMADIRQRMQLLSQALGGRRLELSVVRPGDGWVRYPLFVDNGWPLSGIVNRHDLRVWLDGALRVLDLPPDHK